MKTKSKKCVFPLNRDCVGENGIHLKRILLFGQEMLFYPCIKAMDTTGQ